MRVERTLIAFKVTMKLQIFLFQISSHSSWTAWPWRWRHHVPINTVLRSRRIYCNSAVRNSDLCLAYCIWISLNLIFLDVPSHPVGPHFFSSGNTTGFCDWVQHAVGVYSGTVGWSTALQARRLRVWFPMVSLDFFIDIIIPAALWPWGRVGL
jgi:hypothetical protein